MTQGIGDDRSNSSRSALGAGHDGNNGANAPTSVEKSRGSTLHVGAVLPVLALICVTAVWGSTFFLIKELVETIPPIDFLGVRFLIAGVFVAVFRFRTLLRTSRKIWRRGIALGVVYSLAQVLQTVGLQHTHASVSGFITGMYVVLTPVVLLIAFKVRVSPRTWALIIMATIGLMVLSLNGFAVGFGEFLTFLGALFYAVHIVMLGQWAPKGNVLSLGTIQIMTVGVLCFGAALPGGITVPQTGGQWLQMLYMALVAGVLVIILQTWAQSKISPTSAAIIMTTEPLFAAAFAVAFGGEHITLRLLVGGGLILFAMLGAELKPSSVPGDHPPDSSRK